MAKGNAVAKVVCSRLVSRVRYVGSVIVKALPTVIVIVTPYVAMALAIGSYKAHNGFDMGGEHLVPLALCLVAYILRLLNNVVKDDLDGCPVARKRFTRRGEKGEVLFKSSDIYEMAEYLAEVEDYCEKYGKYRDTK